VCHDPSDADAIGKQLEQMDTGSLVVYRRAVDVLHNRPAGEVVLVVLATGDEPSRLADALRRIRQRWPRCCLVVVGDVGGGRREMVARQGAALYMTRPVQAQTWAALLAHAFGRAGRIASQN
jgi:FixJ family two-component response regulator